MHCRYCADHCIYIFLLYLESFGRVVFYYTHLICKLNSNEKDQLNRFSWDMEFLVLIPGMFQTF